jgi:hypothetical protein
VVSRPAGTCFRAAGTSAVIGRSPSSAPLAAPLAFASSAALASPLALTCARPPLLLRLGFGCPREARGLLVAAGGPAGATAEPPPGAKLRRWSRACPGRCSFLCLITRLWSYLYGGLYGGLYERAHIIRYFPHRCEERVVGRERAVERAASHGRHELAAARKMLGWPKRCKLAHAFLWEYSCRRLTVAQLLGQLGVFLTCGRPRRARGRSARGLCLHEGVLSLFCLICCSYGYSPYKRE